MSKKERFVLVGWPECQFFTNNLTKTHHSPEQDAFLKPKGSSCFVPKEYFEKECGSPVPKNEPSYLAVSFPESQLFMDHHMEKIYLINDEKGVKKYGNAAYFVEEGLYIKVLAEFEKENQHIPTITEFKI